MINYYLITKPGIIFGNLVTLAAGFLLASKGNIDAVLFVSTLVGLTLIMASACIFNNYIDRDIDKKMQRTKNRPSVSGAIPLRKGIAWACTLGIFGVFVLYYYTNTLTVGIASLGFFVYVVLYSLWKCRTLYGTAIGSISGAIPPVVGYCAASNHLDAGAVVLFFMLILWQMPHFFSIAICHLSDYAKAGIPVLPLVKGEQRTKIHMTLYILAFMVASSMLTYLNYTGYFYLIVALAFGSIWFLLSLKGFSEVNSHKWSRQMFRISLFAIMAICFVIPLDLI